MYFLSVLLATQCLGLIIAQDLTTCRTTNLGLEYIGNKTTTRSGYKCQRWDAQTPRRHGTGAKDSAFPGEGLAGAANFCRNPDNSAGGPWCYTILGKKRWQYCSIPMCPSNVDISTQLTQGCACQGELNQLQTHVGGELTQLRTQLQRYQTLVMESIKLEMDSLRSHVQNTTSGISEMFQKQCVAESVDTTEEQVELVELAVDGGWSVWNQWSSCSTTCGDGTQSRIRTCDNPLPENGGASCPGSETEEQTCNMEDCISGVMQSLGPVIEVANRGSTQGQWCKDSLSEDGKVYYLNNYNSNRLLLVFPSEDDFRQNINSVTRTLPITCVGAQGLVYGGRLYCNEYNKKDIVVIDLETLIVVSRITFSDAGYMNKCHYSWGGYSDLDIEADETGLYVIWGRQSQSCDFALSKINTQSDPMTVENTWYIDVPKAGTGNAFMAYGILYVIHSYSARNSYIRYKYDTKAQSLSTFTKVKGIPWFNNYGYMSHAHYDPTERAVFVWDSSHQSKLPVKLL